MDYDILAEQHFLRAHTEERRESETGLIVVRTNSNQLFGKLEMNRQLGTGNSSREGLQTKLKDLRSLLTPACAPSSYVMSLGASGAQMRDRASVNSNILVSGEAKGFFSS